MQFVQPQCEFALKVFAVCTLGLSSIPADLGRLRFRTLLQFRSCISDTLKVFMHRLSDLLYMDVPAISAQVRALTAAPSVQVPQDLLWDLPREAETDELQGHVMGRVG